MTVSTFDPTRDYFEDLKESEKYKDDKGREYPLLKGLIRLAHTNRGGVKEVRSHIVKAPSLNKSDDSQPDCIAAVTVSYYFNDGTVFEGSADASFKAHDAPFNLHLTAGAESKAAARAIRSAFMITAVSKEEIGSAHVAGDPDSGPINDAQINAIRKIAKRKRLSQKDVLGLVGRKDLSDITELTAAEGRKAMQSVNRAKQR